MIAFDLEIAKSIPKGVNWDDYRPFGITCAATVFDDDSDNPHIWPLVMPMREKTYESQLLPCQVDDIIQFLHWHFRDSQQIVTWNGLRFDFRVLAEEGSSESFEMCKEMALNHIDIGFHMLCERGFMIGLDTAAKALGLAGKLEGMTGKGAPSMWRKDRKSQDIVLEYVAQDARTTMEVYQEIVKRGKIEWVGHKGGKLWWKPGMVDSRLLAVQEALKIRTPRRSWSRRKCYEWAEK